MSYERTMLPNIRDSVVDGTSLLTALSSYCAAMYDNHALILLL